MDNSRLWIIKAKLCNRNISLQEIKSLWFEAKELAKNLNDLSQNELDLLIEIFNEVIKRVGEFFDRWIIEKKIQPTDEELDILKVASDEASWVFNFLTNNRLCSAENNEGWQKKIREGKRIISEEKKRRKQIKNLKSQVNFLQTQQNNSNNEREINDLRRQLEELEKKKPNYFDTNKPQQAITYSPKNNKVRGDFYFSIENFLFGLTLGLLIALVIYLMTKEKNKFN